MLSRTVPRIVASAVLTPSSASRTIGGTLFVLPSVISTIVDIVLYGNSSKVSV